MKITLVVSISVFLLACMPKDKYKGYSALDSEGRYFKLLSFSDDTLKPVHGDMMRYTLSQWSDSEMRWSNEGVQVLKTDTGAEGISRTLTVFNEGDSVSLLFEKDAYMQDFGMQMDSASSYEEFRFKVLDVMSEMEWLADQDIDVASKKQQSSEAISEFLSRDENLGRFEERDGIWWSYIDEGVDTHWTVDDELILVYSAYLLDGTLIDERSDEQKGLVYKIGMQGQLIPGLVKVIRAMRKDDEVEVIIPSEQAFGERGVGRYIVPPFAPVRYVLRIVERRPT